jgi:hypothetical protein
VTADIVERLGSILDSEMSPTERAVIHAAQAEIERLRAELAAERALAEAANGGTPIPWTIATIAAWQEARR